MSAVNLYNLCVNISSIIAELQATGIRLEIGDDFSLYRRLRNAQKDRPAIYPMFDVSCSYVDRSNSFWVCGFDENEELVHTQAIRLLDMTGVTLGQHIRMHRHKYHAELHARPGPDVLFPSAILENDHRQGLLSRRFLATGWRKRRAQTGHYTAFVTRCV